MPTWSWLYIAGDDWYEQSYDIEHFTDNWAQFCVVKDTSPIFKVYISKFSDELCHKLIESLFDHNRPRYSKRKASAWQNICII